MTSLETKFVTGTVWKTILIGLIAAAIGWWTMSLQFAGAVLLGVLISALNLKIVGWVGRGMIRSAEKGDTGTAKWSILWVLKLTALFVLTFVFIIVVGVNVFGYIIGYSTFLLAIVWQTFTYIGELDETDDAQTAPQDGDTESL